MSTPHTFSVNNLHYHTQSRRRFRGTVVPCSLRTLEIVRGRYNLYDELQKYYNIATR